MLIIEVFRSISACPYQALVSVFLVLDSKIGGTD